MSSNTFGEVKKDFVEEGPFRGVFYDIKMDDPKVLSNVRLWFTDPDTLQTYRSAQGTQKTIDNEVVYEFNGNTQQVQPFENGVGVKEKDNGVLTKDEPSGETTIEIKSLETTSISAEEELKVGDNDQIYTVQSDTSQTQNSDGEDVIIVDIDPGLVESYPADTKVTLQDQFVGPKIVELQTDAIFLAEVTYQLDVLDIDAVGARKEVLVRESYSIPEN